MRPRVAVFGALGTLVTLLAVGFVFAPDLLAALPVFGALAGALASARPRDVLVAGSVLAAVSLVWAARATATTAEGDAFDAATADPPEEATARRGRLTGSAFQDRVDAAVAGDDAARDDVRRRLRTVAAATYARVTETDRETAKAAVRRGIWTDDRVAAALLADDQAFPLSARLRLWLDAESERRRRIDRTVDAIAALEVPR